LYVGPDGALYVVDYYRQIIEHPEWMGKEVIESGDLYNDADKGRIYRISAKKGQPANWTKGLTLGDATDEELVNRLSDPNSWWRGNAQRLLFERKSKSAIAFLNAMVDNSNSMGRLHALWTLEGLGQLTTQQIEKALHDTEPGIRENAIKLAEAHLPDSPQLANDLVGLQSDTDPKVRYQLLYTLGYINTEAAEKARQRLLFQDIDDKWVQIAALSAKADPMPLLKVVMEKFQEDIPAYTILIQRLTSMVVYRKNNSLIEEVTRSATQAESKKRPALYAALLEGLAQGLQDRKDGPPLSTPIQETLIHTFFESPSPNVRKAALQVLKAQGISHTSSLSDGLTKALNLAVDPSQPEDKRAECIDFISIRNPAKYADVLKKMVTPQEPLSIQLAAIRSLSAIPDTTVSNFLLRKWPSLTPELQDAAINTFLTSDARINILINAIEERKISPSSISWPRRVRLMAQKNIALRERARAIFTTNNEVEVNERYQSALKLEGNIENGKAVFQQNCATCHQVRGKLGVSIGPDLGTIHSWSAAAIMANTLAPNLSISSGYDLWFVELTNGETLQGIIASETPGAITLRNTGIVDKTINRKDIKLLKAMNMSIMTSGFERQITEQQMADLLAFLKQNK
jgi:putative heme-binding domain-containing protein